MHPAAPPLRDPDELPAPLAALVRRAAAGSRDDGLRIALGIEGGGLSVAMACGMALALERLGLTRWLDAVYGTSSGSLMAAYVAGGDTADAEHVLEDACTKDFVRLARLGRSPVVSVDYLMGIVRGRPPLVGAPGRPELRVLAVGVHDGLLRTLGPFAERDDALAAIRASMAIPVWSGPAVAYRGDLLSDGGLIESIPIDTPLAEGATHVIALRSRDWAYRKGKRGRLYGVAEDLVGSRLPGRLPQLIAERRRGKRGGLRGASRSSRPSRGHRSWAGCRSSGTRCAPRSARASASSPARSSSTHADAAAQRSSTTISRRSPTNRARPPFSSSSSSSPTSSRRQPWSVRTSGSSRPSRTAVMIRCRSARAASNS